MTDEKKYIELLKEISELLHSKNSKISMLEYEIQMLSTAITKAEQRKDAAR